MRRWAALVALLGSLSGCETVWLRIATWGDSIYSNALDWMSVEALNRGHMLIPNAIPMSEASDTDYWLPRITSVEAAIEIDCHLVSFGKEREPRAEDVQAIDDALGNRALWLAPRIDPAALAVLEAVVSEERILRVDYELGADGIHASPEGALRLAIASYNACEALQ